MAPLIQVEQLNFAYEFGPPVLSRIDLTIAPGEFLAIVGQNGSGKTTLAKLIVGLLKPSAGLVLVGGHDRATLSVAATAREAAYVFQNPDHQIFAATVEDEVAFGPRNFGLDRRRNRATAVTRCWGPSILPPSATPIPFC